MPAGLKKVLSAFIIYHSSFIILHAQPLPQGRFLTDTIEIGRPFQYALTHRHSPTVEVLFPDTARHFAPYQVRQVAVFATQTFDTGLNALSRDSAVYTLVSFETDLVQLLRVPIRLFGATDCTALFTPVDTVFLRSKLNPAGAGLTAPQTRTLATATELAQLQQQFNYPVLVTSLLIMGGLAGLVYGLFGRLIRRQWQVYQLGRRHNRFLRDYGRLSRMVNAQTAADVANEAVVMWKTYLEQLDRQPYVSLTTPELSRRMNDEPITNALREADQMIYGGSFSAQSPSALRVLSDVATQHYQRRRVSLRSAYNPTPGEQPAKSAEPSSAL